MHDGPEDSDEGCTWGQPIGQPAEGGRGHPGKTEEGEWPQIPSLRGPQVNTKSPALTCCGLAQVLELFCCLFFVCITFDTLWLNSLAARLKRHCTTHHTANSHSEKNYYFVQLQRIFRLIIWCSINWWFKITGTDTRTSHHVFTIWNQNLVVTLKIWFHTKVLKLKWKEWNVSVTQ